MFDNYFQMLRSEFRGYNIEKLTKDFSAGMTVAAVALPLALAFGVGSGANAAAGLITAIIGGIIMSLFSGAAFQISGPTGAMSAVLAIVVVKFGTEGLFTVSLMAGIILLLLGVFKLGKFISLIPAPVITGFTSGIAIIIALGQIDNMFGTTSVGETALERLTSYFSLGFSVNFSTLVLALIVIGVMALWPKKLAEKIPSSLAAIAAATLVSSLLGLDVPVVGAIPRSLVSDSRFSFSTVDFFRLPSMLSPAITVAALAMIESLLCGASAQQMTGGKFNANQELISQGIGNIIIPLFGGVPATAAIARTSVAIKSGCQTRMTGIFHGLGLLASMFFLAPVMSALPLSALAGVLMMTAWRMNEWGAIKKIFQSGFKSAMAQFLLTMICTVVFDLTVAIVIGIEFAMIIFILKATEINIYFSKIQNSKLRGREEDVEAMHGKAYISYVSGVIFFSNDDKLQKSFKELPPCDKIIISLRGVPLVDFVGATTLIEIIAKKQREGTEILLCGVHPKVMETLTRCNISEVLEKGKFRTCVDSALFGE